MKMTLYHDEKLIKRIYDLKREHPEWGVRRIGQAVGVSKDTVHRILKRIQKGEIVITENGEVIDASKPKGIIAYQKMAREALIEGITSHPDHEVPAVQPGTGSQQNFMDFGGLIKEISNGLEPLGKALEKEGERIRKFAEKLFSRLDFVETVKDGIVFGLTMLAGKEYSKKEYLERGIDTSSIRKNLKEISDKYVRQKDRLNHDDSTDVQPR